MYFKRQVILLSKLWSLNKSAMSGTDIADLVERRYTYVCFDSSEELTMFR